MAEPRRKCVGPCGANRALRFFGVDRRRTDGLSEKCLRCSRQRRSASTRGQRLQETYGISLAEFEAILRAQGGVCAICKGKRPGYDLDHSHAVVKAGGDVRSSVRGVLCRRCNRRLLPASLDTVAVLEAAISYLRNPPAAGVIGVASTL